MESQKERWRVGVEGTPLVPPELFLQLLEVAEGQATLSHIQTLGSVAFCAIKIITLGILELYSSPSSIFHPLHIIHPMPSF